jgi:hypothetical protein
VRGVERQPRRNRRRLLRQARVTGSGRVDTATRRAREVRSRPRPHLARVQRPRCVHMDARASTHLHPCGRRLALDGVRLDKGHGLERRCLRGHRPLDGWLDWRGAGLCRGDRSRRRRHRRRDRLDRRSSRLGRRGPAGVGPRRCLCLRRRRQQREWVDVALLISGAPHAEVDERLGGAGRACRAHDRALADCRTTLHGGRAEVQQRRGVPRRGFDRDRLAAVRNGADERDDSCGRREDVGTRRRSEVEAAVLPGGIRVRMVERERAQHPAVHRPRPRLTGRRERKRAKRQGKNKSPEHGEPPLLPELRTERP